MKVHGGAPRGYLDFSAPSNPLGPPPILRVLLSQSLSEGVERYPNPSYGDLIESVKEFYGLDESVSVIPLNGAAEAYSLLPLVLRPRTIVSIDPTFGDLDDIATACGARRLSVCMHVGSGSWVADPSEVMEVLNRVERPCLAVVSIPNNPTGTVIPHDVVREVSRKCVVLADYAFRDLSSIDIPLIIEDNVLALLSLTKSLSIPGLRIGFILGPAKSELIQRVEMARQPWNVNGVAAALVTKLLKDFGEYVRSFLSISRETVAELRRVLEDGLTKLGFEVYSSVAPFVLARHEFASSLARCLASSFRIAIRSCSSFKCLDETFVRISVRPLDEIKAFLSALERCLDWASSKA